MYTISKEFHFSASHVLLGLEETHPCSRMHGHNYVITIEIQATKLDGPGFVIDYRRLEPIKKWIDSTLDHRHLNDVLEFNPTAENMARYFFYHFPSLLADMRSTAKISAVCVKETEKTLARYEG